MLSQDHFFYSKAPEIIFLMMSSSILEAFWEPSWLTYRLLVAPVTKIADMVNTLFQTRKNDSLGFDPGWWMVEVGGRGGASGGRGRLRLRAMQGIVSHIQHALLPLNEVRRI